MADLPPAALADGTVVAKAWLVRLVEAAPLAGAGDIPARELAREGPALCAAVLRALGSDAELARLGPAGDRQAAVAAVARLAGADGPAAIAAAVAALRDAIWAALSVELPRLDGATTAALAGRLAHVYDLVLQLGLTDAAGAPPPPDRSDAEAAERPWLRAIERLLAAAGEDQAPFAVLAVELDGAERVLAADPDGGAEALARVERAVRSAAPSTAVLVREPPARMWIVAPGAGRGDARALGERMVDATEGAAVHRGAPLTVSIGTAVCPDDAGDAERLAALADEGVFAARAAGLRLT